jgi:hypothetical protein
VTPLSQLRPRKWANRGILTALLLAIALAPRGAPATVAEQRARLPPPADCQDPVAGVWKSHSWDNAHLDWTIFTLEVKRVEPGGPALVGAITNHTWIGKPEESQPGVCRNLLRYLVSMDARGTVVGGEIEFGGIGEWHLDEVLCGDWGSMGYNLDNFSGTIDPELHEFQSVNNDGGRAVNDPTVFRRVACLDGDEPPVPKIAVTAPPFYPPGEEASGCGVQ